MRLPLPRNYIQEWIVGEELWELKFKRKLENTEKNHGLCDPSEKIIYIKQKIGHADTFYTFIHELIHAFEEEYDFKLAHSHVYKLERAVGDFILTNPQSIANLWRKFYGKRKKAKKG